jgi:hypothetical protein
MWPSVAQCGPPGSGGLFSVARRAPAGSSVWPAGLRRGIPALCLRRTHAVYPLLPAGARRGTLPAGHTDGGAH